jgi:hypothetical protein
MCEVDKGYWKFVQEEMRFVMSLCLCSMYNQLLSAVPIIARSMLDRIIHLVVVEALQ